MSTRVEVLVEVAELSALLASTPPAGTLLDVRWRLGEPAGAGHERYAAGHLPGAIFLDLEQVLTRHTGDPRDGRHPLPEPNELAAALGDLGVTPGAELVVYDEAGSFAAARAWWVLRWAGLRVRVLDGGIDAWTGAGHPLTTELPSPARTTVAVRPGAVPVADIDGAAAAPHDGLLLDVRAPERYRGETEPLDPVAGHIPGAVNLPVSGMFAADGTLPDAALVRERLRPALEAAAAGRPVVVSCGSGVSAAQTLLALRALGIDAALYPGSWSAWCNTPGRPVATGPLP